MTSYATLFNQLPQRLQVEMPAHIGSTAGMSEVQIVTRYRDVAWWLKSTKLAALPQGYAPHSGHLTAQEFNGLGSPVGVAPEIAEITNQFIAYESAWHLENFVNQLQAVINQLDEAARVQAQRQAEEAARQLAQHQAEEAARLHAQRLAEEAAREVAARQLAEQQAYAAAQALAEQKAQEAALQEARLALELAAVGTTQPPETAVNTDPTSNEIIPATKPAREIFFIPGPAAMAEIERATVVLKHSIDAAVVQYASHRSVSEYITCAGSHCTLTQSRRGNRKPKSADSISVLLGPGHAQKLKSAP